MEKFFYRIQGFEPPDDDRLGGYGFNIIVSPDFCKKALNKCLPEVGYNNLQRYAKNIVDKIMPNRLPAEPLNFFPMNEKEQTLSCLLQSCSVPGNACSLGVSWAQLSGLKKGDTDSLHYDPHNVDDKNQAFALLSIWLKWANLVESFVERE